MAVGILLVIVGLWLLINGVNGNLAGVLTGNTKFNPSVTAPQPTGANAPGQPFANIPPVITGPQN
jgi:hypothetical protein